MKKIFTLIAVAAMALTVNAQGKYAMEEGETIAAGTQPAKDKRVENCKLVFGEGGDDFKAAVADASVEGYTAYTQGNGINGNKENGTFYLLTPSIDGKITVAVVLNADKAFYIEEDGTALEQYNGIKVDSKYYGTYSFDVKANKTYKVYCAGSKLGFYGFEYTTEVTGIQSAKAEKAANTESYNLAGQKVSENYKGVVIMNGKKVVK
jgi:hypothetical protein